jgi:hypothetical protein
VSDIVLRTPLKCSPTRSVHVETMPGGDVRRVVKRFHGRGPCSVVRDGRRARAEFENLSELHRRGLSVPTPHALGRLGNVWEVSMQWLPGTVTLQSLFPARDLWLQAPERLATTLGHMLAELHAAGLDHPDLHAGNVLIGESGRAWAIDFHGARFRKHLGGEILQRDLVRLAAGAREFVSRRFRARFLLAWWHRLPSGLRDEVGPPDRLVHQVERSARLRRRALVHKRRRRWTRTGSAVRRIRERGLLGYERVDLESGWARRLSETLAQQDSEARFDLPFPGQGARRLLVLRSASYRRLRETWLAAVRLFDHRIPVMGPLCLLKKPLACAAFEVPRQAAFLSELEPADLPPRAQLAGQMGRLCGALHDRHLAPLELLPEHILITPPGDVVLAGIPSLVSFDPFETEPRRRDFARWCSLIGGREPSFKRAFHEAYLEAWRGPLLEREILGRELVHA